MVAQGRLLSLILSLIYTVEFHYVLYMALAEIKSIYLFYLYFFKWLGVLYNFYADDTPIYFTFESINEAENKHGVSFNKVDQWM